MEAWPIKAVKATPISRKTSNLWQTLTPPVAEILRGKIPWKLWQTAKISRP